MNNLLTTLHTAMDEAAHRVMAIYADPDRFDTRRKADDSPVTAADLAAHDCLVAHLRAVAPDIPVVSEEARPAPWSERRHWSRCWIIDPLDGTKEFLKRNDEFTINVGLVEGGQPVLGMVDAPALGERYYAIRGEGPGARALGPSREAFGWWSRPGPATAPGGWWAAGPMPRRRPRPSSSSFLRWSWCPWAVP